MVLNFCGILFDLWICFVTVDGYNRDEHLECKFTTRYWESQVSLAVVVDQTFTLGCVDARAQLFIDLSCVRFFAC